MRRILDRDPQKEKRIEQSKFHLSGAVMFTQDGLMDALQFYVFFNSISVTSGRKKCDNERLCAMEPTLHLKRYPPQDIRLK